MKIHFNEKAANWPKDKHALTLLKRQIELGELGEPGNTFFPWPIISQRYLVTFMQSVLGNRIRSSTVITITNQSRFTNKVAINYYKGFSTVPAGTCTYSIPPGLTVDFGTRSLPMELTAVNCVSKPELTFDEGRAIVSSVYPEIAVSARVYYTEGDKDSQLLSISDSKVVTIGKGNLGD